MPWTTFIILLFLAPRLSLGRPTSTTLSSGIHLPIQRRAVPPGLRKRASRAGGLIGLGDVVDVTYNVLVSVGGVQTPLVLDTGSSDLWVLSDACTNECTTGVQLFPLSQFNKTGLPANLQYGDSFTGTRASGSIGWGTVGVAGLDMQDQYFAAVDSTNTSVLRTGSAGIFGLGFPINSVIFTQLFKAVNPQDISSSSSSSSSGGSAVKRSAEPDPRTPSFPTLPSHLIHGNLSANVNLRMTQFPTLPSSLVSSKIEARASTPLPSNVVNDVLNAYPQFGPLVSRMIYSQQLSSPQVTIALQRDYVDIGGNVGMLSIGEFPQGLTNDNFTWAGIRGYSPAQGGLPPPANSPGEVYPIAWEVPLDGIYLDGIKLPHTNLSDPNIHITGLIDTGNSLIRGPQDVVNYIYTQLGMDITSSSASFPCSTPHTLAFEIAGVTFPVDPRDFISQQSQGNLSKCLPNIVPTDAPSTGFLYSWSLGIPFLKSVLVSFYYGNISYPSKDSPRLGFHSTVPPNALSLYMSALSAASASGGGNLPSTSVSAPNSVPTGAPGYGTDLNGVVLAVNNDTSSGGKKGLVNQGNDGSNGGNAGGPGTVRGGSGKKNSSEMNVRMVTGVWGMWAVLTVWMFVALEL